MKTSKLSLKAKILSGVLAGGMILSAGTSAFATNAATTTTKSKIEYTAPMDKMKFNEERMAEMNTILQEVLKEGVTSKIITQEESTKIKEYTDKKAEEAKEFIEQRQAEAGETENRELKGGRMGKKGGKMGQKGKGGLFAELVSEGIITQEKADALREKVHVKTEALREAKLKEDLANLVTNKTLTQDQANKIEAAIKAENEARKADFEKVKDMTEEERHKYMQDAKENRVDPIKTLVENGTITEAQEKEVRQVLPRRGGKHHGAKARGAAKGNVTVDEKVTATE